VIRSVPLIAFAIALWAITVTVVPVADQKAVGEFVSEAWHFFMISPPLPQIIIMIPVVLLLAADFFENI
jgi:hypothetical protein